MPIMTIHSLSIEPSLTAMRSLHIDNVGVRQRLDSKREREGAAPQAQTQFMINRFPVGVSYIRYNDGSLVPEYNGQVSVYWSKRATQYITKQLRSPIIPIH